MPHDGLVFDIPAREIPVGEIPAGGSAGDGCPLLIREVPYRDPVAAFAPWSGQPFATLLHSAAAAGARQSQGSHGYACAGSRSAASVK